MTQRGFSLIEALIALLVLSIGLIGVAAMQIKALQSATAGYQRSVATLAAVDAQEQLWAELALLNETEDCTSVDVEKVEGDWKELWSADNDSNPLRNTQWGNNASRIDRNDDDDCEFTITLMLSNSLGGINTNFEYTFRLPKKPGG